MEAFDYRYNPDRHSDVNTRLPVLHNAALCYPLDKLKTLIIGTTLETASMRLELLSRINILVSAQRRSLPSIYWLESKLPIIATTLEIASMHF